LSISRIQGNPIQDNLILGSLVILESCLMEILVKGPLWVSSRSNRQVQWKELARWTQRNNSKKKKKMSRSPYAARSLALFYE